MSSPDAYDSALPRGSDPRGSYTRVYRRYGRLAGRAMAHLRRDGVISCLGTLYDEEKWLGTGSQDEYDDATALPLCPRCFELREAQLPDSRLGTGHAATERR